MKNQQAELPDIVTMRVPDKAALYKMLDDLRRLEDDLPPRSTMLRLIVERAHGQAMKKRRA